MDWDRDNTGISEHDFVRIFRYESKASTVLRKLHSDPEPIISSLETEKEWDDWLGTDLPSPKENKSGLVLIIARRTGEPPVKTIRRTNTDEWLGTLQTHLTGKESIRAFGGDIEKLAPVNTGLSSLPSPMPIGRSSLRTLPFSQEVFRSIAEGFHVHGSIARTISRADIPVFSAANVLMGRGSHPAIVYTTRSSNAWEMDLALSITYFPHCGLTYAILFGCPLPIEREVIKRIRSASEDTHHPLLMPGIFTELERARHIKLVEKTIDDLEMKILELDTQASQARGRDRAEVERQNQEKRSSWLDTTYLRNNLITWTTQLRKMASHEKELSCGLFRSRLRPGRTPWSTERRLDSDSDDSLSMMDGSDDIQYFNTASTREYGPGRAGPDGEATRIRLRRTGRKIRHRLLAMIDEYDDKIRDCTMRVDGMAMATQWANGESNVEIALATSRDSQHMRSIALITMVFLPGTFLASFFSMTFFDWFGENSNGSQVSGSIWIYVVVTTIVTLLTVGSWYYWVIWRNTRMAREAADEIDEPLHRRPGLRQRWKRLISRDRHRGSPGIEE